MKRIIYTLLMGLLWMSTTIGQPTENLTLNLPETEDKLHQATNSIKFNPGYSSNGKSITANITKSITSHPNIIALGPFSTDFEYTDTQNTALLTNYYEGFTTKDVVHQFTLGCSMEIIISHCGSQLEDTYMSLLDAAGNLLEENNDFEGDSVCGNKLQAYIRKFLVPGTYYLVSEGGYGEDGIIQTSITGYYYNNEFNYPEIPGTHSSDTRAVGAVAGSFAVSATGGATYSVPIEVPAGVGGMQPSLAITYNSQSGNGVVGFGASLSGISAITRAPKNIYHDTLAKGLTYLGDDAFLLNGQRLVYSSGTPGQNEAVYYPESDPFTKVTVHGSYTPTSCDTWFEVADKNGMKYFYGQTGTTSRQTYTIGGVNRVNAWYLNHVEDPLGNVMDYEYTMSSCFLRLSAIEYGKNKNITTSFVNRVELLYETRTDQMPFVLEGVKGVMDIRLQKIISKTGTSVFREYSFEYTGSELSIDKFSRLQYITVKNGAGEELKPTRLNWNHLPLFKQLCYYSTVKDTNFSPSASFADQAFQAGDMNGDGISDLIGLFQNGTRFYAHIYTASIEANGIPKFQKSKYYDLGISYNNEWLDKLVQKGGFSTLDMDGDGINEFLVPTLQNINGGWEVVFAVNSETVYEDAEYHLNSSEMPLYATGDFDNNGKIDFIWTEKESINNNSFYILKYNTVTDKLESIQYNLTLTNSPEKIFADDYNGDGLTDVMVFMKGTPGGYTIFWNQGNGINAQTLNNNARYDGSTIADNWMIRPGDFNGDGLTDFIMNETNSTSWNFALNNGDGTFTKQLACSLDIYDQEVVSFVQPNDLDDNKFNCLVFDFDFDGKSDVVIHKVMYEYNQDYSAWFLDKTYTYWMRSKGTTLERVSMASSSNEPYGKSKYVVTGDFNGDGKAELMNYGQDIYNYTVPTDIKWRYYRNPDVSAGTGMLSSVTSGYGLKDSISYASLTDTSTYTKGFFIPYPGISVPPAFTAVQSVIHDNGIAGTVSEEYKYSGAKVHLQGKGFLGFQSVTTTNITTGVKTESGYTKLDAKRFIPLETYSKTTLDGRTAIDTMKYTFIGKGGKKYFAYPNSKTTLDLDSNKYTTTYAFDTIIGYLTEEKTIFDGNPSMYKTTQYESYILAGGRFQPQMVTSIGKHSDDSQTFTKRTAFTYDTIKGYPLTKVENSGTDLALTTNYTSYDAFGNLKEYKVSGSGVPELTYKTEYDPTNRFVSKKYTYPASDIVSFVYDTWGNVTSQKDETNAANLLTTVHTYNNWGQKTSTTLSDGTKTSYHTGWDDKDEKKKYFTLTQGKGQPWVKTWYDATGRETAAESSGPKGMEIESTKQYNNKGELFYTYSRQGNLSSQVNYLYDGRGRLKEESIEYGKKTEYIYGNRTVSIQSNGNISTKTFDAWGGIKSVADPLAGNVTYTYKSVGKPWEINANGAISTMDYDEAGNQKMLNDPNTDSINYTYDAAGRVKTQVDNKGNNLSVSYDAQGRKDTLTLAGIQTIYSYGTTGYQTNRLTKVQTGANSVNYTYDGQGRPATESRVIDGAGQVDFVFGYNSDGQLQTTTYPGGVQVTREYDPYGNQVKIQAGGQTVWELTGAEGKVTTTRLGGTMTATRTLDAQGFLAKLKTTKGNTVLRDMDFGFNAATGNLSWRTGISAQKETFLYDELDRLKTVKEGVAEVETMFIDYHSNGNISYKTGLGPFIYDGLRPHAVDMVDYNINLMPSTVQSINYNAFNKADCLKDTIGSTGYQLDILYGPDQQRWKSVLKRNGSDVKTIIFAGDYEKFIENGVTKELYYVGADDGLVGILVKPQVGASNMYYAHTDHLGSIVSLTDSAGVAVFKASYDAWGKQTVSLNTIGFQRGYTGHEHLPEFGLINMNGRMYDPVLGRFLSPDNYVQAADFSQSFNRYSYCMNNPLVYTDPSGEFWHIIIGAAIGGIVNTIAHADQIHDAGDFFMAFGIGAAGGALVAATGGAALSVYGTTSAVAVGAGGFIGAAVSAGVGYTFGTMTTSMGNAMYFGDPMPTGKQFLTGLGITMATAGALQGINAHLNGRNFFTGNPTGNGVPTPGPTPNLNLDKPVESKINTNGLRSELKSMPDTPDNPTFWSVNSPDGQTRWINQENLSLSPRQSLHLGNTGTKSPLTINPNTILGDLNKGNYQFIKLNSRGMPIVKFEYPIGNVFHQGTGANLGSTYYGTVHINNSGQVHVVPWLYR